MLRRSDLVIGRLASVRETDRGVPPNNGMQPTALRAAADVELMRTIEEGGCHRALGSEAAVFHPSRENLRPNFVIIPQELSDWISREVQCFGAGVQQSVYLGWYFFSWPSAS